MSTSILIQLALGTALLLLGKRLTWLLAAGAGFALGLYLNQGLLAGLSPDITTLVPWALAAVFGLITLLGKQVLLNVVGFVAGGVAFGWLLTTFGLAATDNTLLTLGAFVVGGLAGMTLLSRLFDLGMIVLSSLLGAQIVLLALQQLVELPDGFGSIALIVLVGIGVLVQLGIGRKK